MRFLVDAQLPPVLVRMLVDLGHSAEHVTDIGPGDAPLIRSSDAAQALDDE